jgi:hypothetical protein
MRRGDLVGEPRCPPRTSDTGPRRKGGGGGNGGVVVWTERAPKRNPDGLGRFQGTRVGEYKKLAERGAGNDPLARPGNPETISGVCAF